ncbi:MAG: hypothetical protein ACLU3I_08575 [Acutalibacteraceae bacterium]
MKQAVNCAVKADRAIRCPICQRGRLLNAAEHTDLRSLQLFRLEQADRAQWFSEMPEVRAANRDRQSARLEVII